jgi:hypothetical protein
MNRKVALKLIWILPIISIFIQAFLILVFENIIEYNISTLQANDLFWTFYTYYAIFLIIYAFLFLILIRLLKNSYWIILTFSIIIFIAISISFSLLITRDDFFMTLTIISIGQFFFFMPFYLGVHKCYKYM